jgi:hypothetical protein
MLSRSSYEPAWIRRAWHRETRADVAADGPDRNRFLGEPFDQPGQPVTLVTYPGDPREDLAVLSSPSAILINAVRVR